MKNTKAFILFIFTPMLFFSQEKLLDINNKEFMELMEQKQKQEQEKVENQK